MIDLPLAEKIVAFLNECTALDPDAITALIERKVPCNDALGEHPTVQSGGVTGYADVGMLGILNGLCGAYDDGPRKSWGAIAAVYVDDAESLKMPALCGFAILKNEAEPEKVAS